MNAFDLTGKKILVTGASSGLGKQSAITLSNYGAQLFITGRNTERLQKTFDQLEGDHHSQIIADLTDLDQINKLVEAMPKLNGILYSTGVSSIIPAGFVKPEELDRVMEANFKTTVNLNTAILKKKKIEKGGSILFITTISTTYPFVGGSLYVSSKAALEGYARVLTLELAQKKIRINCLRPAFVKGPMLDDTEKQLSKEIIEQIDAKQPLGLGKPEDVAHAVVFFLSDASKWITGTNIILGGG